MTTTIPNRTRIGVLTLVFAAAAAAVAQRALDANLNALGGRSNPVAPNLAAAPELYTYSKYSGELVYNRANAFNDNAYMPYQRYAIDRSAVANPGGRRLQANTAAGVQAQYTGPRVATVPAQSTGLGAPAYRPGARRNSVSGASRQSLNRVSYRVR